MNKVMYRLSLDIHETSSQAMIPIKLEDNNRSIEFTLREDGKKYHITEDCTATFRAKKPDGTVLYNSCTIEDDVITYNLTSETASAVGILECELTINGADERQITSPRFNLCVDERVYSDDEIESTDEFTALQDAIEAVGNLDIEAEQTASGVIVTITDKDGVEHTVEIHDGTAIEDATVDSRGHLIISFTDGTTIDAGEVKGDKGDKGDTGDAGAKGDKGDKGDTGNTGATGNGIASISKTSTSGNVDTYTITFTNGTTTTFTVTNGTDGGNIPETTNLLKGDGSGNALAASPNIDYTTPSNVDGKISAHDSNNSAHSDIRGELADKQDTISDLETIRDGAALGATALQSVPSTYRTAAAQDVIDGGKQPTISDLATIRSGAALGATAVQPESGKGLFSGNYNDLSNKPTIPAEQVNSDWNATSGKAQILNKPTIPTVPTNISAFTNDAGYLTSHQSLAAYRTAAEQDVIDNGKVDKVSGKGLSSNDYTTAEMNKLAGIEADAEVNEIDTIAAGANVTVSKNGKTVTISASDATWGDITDKPFDKVGFGLRTYDRIDPSYRGCLNIDQTIINLEGILDINEILRIAEIYDAYEYRGKWFYGEVEAGSLIGMLAYSRQKADESGYEWIAEGGTEMFRNVLYEYNNKLYRYDNSIGRLKELNQVSDIIPGSSNVAITKNNGVYTISVSDGGGSIPATTNLIMGDGSGRGADSGITSGEVIQALETTIPGKAEVITLGYSGSIAPELVYPAAQHPGEYAYHTTTSKLYYSNQNAWVEKPLSSKNIYIYSEHWYRSNGSTLVEAGYVTSATLNDYRTATDQDAIDSAQNAEISAKEASSNKVTSISASSTDTQYPSAKAVYSYIQSLDGNGVAY